MNKMIKIMAVASMVAGSATASAWGPLSGFGDGWGAGDFGFSFNMSARGNGNGYGNGYGNPYYGSGPYSGYPVYAPLAPAPAALLSEKDRIAIDKQQAELIKNAIEAERQVAKNIAQQQADFIKAAQQADKHIIEMIAADQKAMAAEEKAIVEKMNQRHDEILKKMETQRKEALARRAAALKRMGIDPKEG